MLRTAFAAALAAGLLAPAPAHAAASLDNCTGFIDALPAVIGTPGTWCLRRDLSTAIGSGSAIQITADDVTLDCNGFGIAGLAGAGTFARGVYSDGNDNATVRHCSIRGFRFGAMIFGSANLVEDNRIEDSHIGLWVTEEVGFGTGYTRGISTIRRNLVADSRSSGLYTYGSMDISDNLVDGVDAPTADASTVGISLESAVGATVARNVVRNVQNDNLATYGIYISNNSNGVMVRENVVVAMPGSASNAGIFCDGTGSVVANQVSGWPGAIVGCGTQHDNDILP